MSLFIDELQTEEWQQGHLRIRGSFEPSPARREPHPLHGVGPLRELMGVQLRRSELV